MSIVYQSQGFRTGAAHLLHLCSTYCFWAILAKLHCLKKKKKKTSSGSRSHIWCLSTIVHLYLSDNLRWGKKKKKLPWFYNRTTTKPADLERPERERGESSSKLTLPHPLMFLSRWGGRHQARHWKATDGSISGEGRASGRERSRPHRKLNFTSECIKDILDKHALLRRLHLI